MVAQGVSLHRLGIDREIAGALGLRWDPASFLAVQLALPNMHVVGGPEFAR